MKKIYSSLLTMILFGAVSENSFSQLAFNNANIRLNSSGHSGCSMAVTDWNGDGLDDIVRLDDGNDVIVEVQRTNNTYETRSLGSFNQGSTWAWAMCVVDLDHNGYKDILAGGYGPAVMAMMVDNSGTVGNIVSLSNSNFFLQNITFGDFNSDGWIDVFCCDDNDAGHLYVNDGTGTLLPSTLIPLAVNPGVFIGGDPADSGNYGSVWTDFDNDGDLDLYVAHCRQGVNSNTDLRRINRLFVNDGNNNYTEMGAAYGLDIGWQSWTASFGDIDNDGDLDLMLTNHDFHSQILQNDGTGHFTDITPSTGFDISDITPIESVMEDFDNDGWIDILAAGSDSRYYKNNGNSTFSEVNGLFDNNNMESFAIGDLNHDGSIDIYGGYADIYTTPTNVDDVIWMNQGNSNHFFTLDLRGVFSNHSAIGARAKIYGSWGVQLREVRAGESYGTVNSSMLHFGLGQATVIDSAVINWPSGATQTIINPSPDQFLTIREGDCVSPEAILNYPSTVVLCTGLDTTFYAPAGFDYLWSDGSSLQSLFVNVAGEYNVRISTPGNNCNAVSKTLKVVYDPDETPVIQVSGVTEFCNGTSVQLMAPPGFPSYTWSNGDTNQNANITQSGTYSLTIQGHCQNWNSSNSIDVTVHTAVDPVSSDVTLAFPGSATLNATGNNISWYDVASGGSPVATGNIFNTPVLYDTTVYYAEAADNYGGGIYAGGLPIHTGGSLYSGDGNTSATTSFNVAQACTLTSVKVYTDMPGYRLIELKDNAGWLINSAYVNILPDSTIVPLGWYLVPGVDYTIGTNNDTNLVIPGWGYTGPRLQRNNSGVTYPYTINNGAVEITNSSLGNSLYYYFYDWQIEMTTYYCPSNRIPVTVNVNSPVGVAEATKAGISIYPNPATDKLLISSPGLSNAEVRIYDMTARLVKSEKLLGKKQELNISSLTKGVYNLEIRTEKTNFVYKLVVN